MEGSCEEVRGGEVICDCGLRTTDAIEDGSERLRYTVGIGANEAFVRRLGLREEQCQRSRMGFLRPLVCDISGALVGRNLYDLCAYETCLSIDMS